MNTRLWVFLLVLVAVTSFALGMIVGTPNPDMLGPCKTEDSTNCYWDASEQGNGQGKDFVAP